MSMALGVNVDREGMLPLVANAINIMFHNPKDVFWTGPVFDLLYNGIEIDCTSNDLNVLAVCAALDGGEFETIKPIENKENFFQFSFFGNVSSSLILCSVQVYASYIFVFRFRNIDQCHINGSVESAAWCEKHTRLG